MVCSGCIVIALLKNTLYVNFYGLLDGMKGVNVACVNGEPKGDAEKCVRCYTMLFIIVYCSMMHISDIRLAFRWFQFPETVHWTDDVRK